MRYGVKSSGATGGPSSSSSSSSAAAAAAAASDEAYAARHRLWVLLENLAGMLLLQRPQRPVEAVVLYLDSQAHQAVALPGAGAAAQMRRAAADPEAAEYLQGHGVAELLEGMAAHVLAGRPPAPTAALLSYAQSLLQTPQQTALTG